MERARVLLAAVGCWLVCASAHAQTSRRLLAQGEYARAERELRAGSSAESQTLLARLLIETGRYSEAAERAQQAAADASQRVAAGTLRGDALLAQGLLDEAERAYREISPEPLAFRARAKLGALLIDRGRKAEALPLLEELLRAYEQRAATRPPALLGVALAAQRLGKFQLANQVYREAALLDRTRADTQLEWAQMFLEKYDQKHAAESVLEALEHNPNHALGHVLMARLQLMQSMDFDEADRALERALAVNPNLVIAYVTRAGMALRNMELTAADAALDRALSVNPNDLEALSMRAAVRFLAADSAGFGKAKRAVLALSPGYSRMYTIIAEYAEWEHRYPELVQLAREALGIDPEDAQARATLGLNLLRMGEERAGLEALRAAWERDQFNVQVFNTLNLYEKAIAQDYVSFASKPFEIRLYKAERPVLEPYLVPLLQRAYGELRKRYAFTPEGPLHIELYADQVQFSVRTTGLPSIGVQGVCFGKVVTGLSPRAAPYNWGQIVWHELSHVFHLQLSKGRVPRWFTEGLAEYETTLARPEWKREDDPLLYDALRSERLPGLDTMNRVFTRARTPRDMMTAYYTAYSAVKYLVERFGIERVRSMLRLWGEGQSSAQVAQNALGLSLADLDRDFRTQLAQRLSRFVAEFQVDFGPYRDLVQTRARAKQAPADADAQAGLALAETIASNFDAAAEAAQRALRISPQHRLANFALARVALERGDAAGAEGHLRAILASGADGYLLRMLLFHAALAHSQPTAALAELDAAIKLDPDRPEAWQNMLELAGKQKDESLALRAVSALAQLDQHDRAIHAAYVALLTKREAWPDVVRAGESAMYVDPANPALHWHLGRAYASTGRPADALTELDRALALGHPEVGDIQLTRARVLVALGKRNQAKAAAQAAVDAEPDLREESERVLRGL
ncbi:MAG TPA: tetratricopeptide repeat protein [Polyangiales bacterium]|nr:tetratricopeptide repeat protein [Polyangiales bacterium]